MKEKSLNLSQELKNKNQLITLSGIINGSDDFQIIQTEKIFNNRKIPKNKPSLKEILENKNICFNKEYLALNSLYTSINCYIKIFNKYLYGNLIIKDKYIIVQANKKVIRMRDWSFSDISTTNAKNNSSDNQLPTYFLNDTIDKIITGRNVAARKNKELPIYLININLDLVTCKIVIHKEKQKFRLLLLGNKSNKYIQNIKILKFNLINVEKSKFYHICEIINKSILLSEGSKTNIFGVNLWKNYFTKSFINVFNFINIANTCDILLFKSDSSSSKLQRCITKGDFDHIILLVRTENNLKLYDCIENEGMRLRNFTELFPFRYLNYKKIVYRKLNINIEDMVEYIHNNIIDKYENIDNYTIENMSPNEIKNKYYEIMNAKLAYFIKNNSNAKYDFPYCKYLCKSKRTNNKYITKRKSFFCSELIAAVYMFCRIMDDKYDPFDYLPSEFSEKGKITFINGFHLGPEIIIDFSNF